MRITRFRRRAATTCTHKHTLRVKIRQLKELHEQQPLLNLNKATECKQQQPTFPLSNGYLTQLLLCNAVLAKQNPQSKASRLGLLL
jgi:hypothetical protein